MSKNDKKNIKQGLSFFQATALVLIIIAILFALGVIYYQKNIKTNQYSQAIVVTEDTHYENIEESQTQDLIGDFILNHEYFTADAEVLQENSEIMIKEEIAEDVSETITVPQEENSLAEQREDVEIETFVSQEQETILEENIENLPENNTPLIAVIIDDMGINHKRTLDIISLKAPLTSSFLTYGKNLESLAEQAKNSGHEIMIHAPMEPKVDASLAPDTLKTDMSKEEIESSFLQMLKKFADIDVKGINNHMGSKFTEDKERLSYIMDILKTKNMFFLDSKTTSLSKGKEIAIENGINFISRDVFLDNENNYDYIFSQLIKAEKIALKKGYAVAICHPKSNTYLALKDWIETLKDKEIKLVHVSQIIQKIN